MGDYCVCAEPIEERGVYPCGHALCLSCTLKKRTLMKDLQCPYCRVPAKQVAVVSNATTDPSQAHFEFQPGNLRVENKNLSRKLRHIMDFPCPECDECQKNYKTLKSHVLNQHEKAVCDVCTRHEYNFSDEYRLFEPEKIKEHLRKQHILCKYCKIYFYGTTEFSKHCRQTHMGCGICEHRDPEHPLYFRTYDQLYDHYKQKHYMCMVPTCLENKHIVFGTALELKRHMIEAHKGLINNSRQAQQVDLDQLSQDAEDAQSGTSHGPSLNETESESSRYEARLEIAAGHDRDKIEKLRGANKTFLKKMVPVDIFIATYEGVLKETSKTELTALLSAFKKGHKSQLSPEASRALGFKIDLRLQAEREVEDQKMRNSGTTKQPSQANQQRGRVPPSTPIPNINWGYNVPIASGIGDISSLPKLGSKSQASSSSNGATHGRTWNPRQTGPPITALKNLPTLAKKTNPYESAKPNPYSIRQTSTPLGDSRSNHSTFFASLRSGQSGPLQSVSPQPSPQPSSSSSSSLSSSPRSSPQPGPSVSSANSRQERIQLGSLPQLPKKTQQPEKKRQRNVLRIV